MEKHHRNKPFARYADDAVAHCRSREDAEGLLESLETRFAECLCQERANEHDAVFEMKVDPSKSVCRSRLQTAVSCFSPKGCGGERYGKSRGKPRHVWIRETNASEPLIKHRKQIK